MRTKICQIAIIVAAVLWPGVCFAATEHPTIFHAFNLEADVGESRSDTVASWDLDGWIGGDYDKFAVKSEGEIADSEAESAEIWAMYSRNIAPFWDAQVGLRYDLEPESLSYLTLGLAGLAKYLFETELHLFLSEEADVSARLRQENDLLLTQRLIISPYFEISAFAQDIESQDVGAGFSEGEFGLQLRYEITRKFAPYLDVSYLRKFGETSSIAQRDGERRDDWVASVGCKLMF